MEILSGRQGLFFRMGATTLRLWGALQHIQRAAVCYDTALIRRPSLKGTPVRSS